MYKKKGYPEVGDYVICTVTKVLPHSAFASLDEYEGREGMIHASELSRKWARNLRSYMKIGNKLICKIMDVDQKTNHINLSVRRVGASKERAKKAEWKNEKRANDLLEIFAKQVKISIEEAYAKIGNPIIDKYGLLYPLFLDIAKYGKEALSDLKIDNKLANKFIEIVQNRITIPKAHISGVLKMHSNASNGIEVIKNVINDAKELAKKKNIDLNIEYLGTPKYKIDLYADEYKELESGLNEIIESIKDYLEKNMGEVEFKRSTKK